MRNLLIASGLLYVCMQGVMAQENRPGGDTLGRWPRFGVVGGVNLNLHVADFSELPGVPNCSPGFRFGLGVAPSAALLYERSLGLPWLLQARLGYSAEGAVLTRAEHTVVDMNGRAAPIDINHSVTASLGSIGLEPLVGYQLHSRLSLLAGGRLGYLVTRSYSQKEQLADNARQGSFENGRRSRNESSGAIAGASPISASLMVGVSYEMPLNASGTVLAAPELFLRYGLTPVVSDMTWSTHGVRAGIALKYAPMPQGDTVAAPPSVPLPPALAGRVDAVGVAENGAEEPVAWLRVEEFLTSDVRPLLAYLFFAEGSADLDPRYSRMTREDARAFHLDSLHGSGTLSMYHQVLNVIGRRMREHPRATLRLLGSAGGAEGGNRDLARRRAEVVAAYLRDVWSIAPDRLQADAADMPTNPSNGAYAEGAEENRRVEITSSDPVILDPIRTSDTIRQATPPTIRFRTDVASEVAVRSWVVMAQQRGEILKEFSGEGPVPATLDWRITREQPSAPRLPGEIHYAMVLTDSAGRRYQTPLGRIAVEQMTVRRKRTERIADLDVERYSLILFEYDRADITAEHGRALEDMRGRIRENSTVVITGYTDRLGDAQHNRRLALERARSVAKALGVAEDRVVIVGEPSPPYENSSPEGRFYSRTVTIEIRTAVVEGDSG